MYMYMYIHVRTFLGEIIAYIVRFTGLSSSPPPPSLTQRTFQGPAQQGPAAESQRLGCEAVGGKELTGFSENNCPLLTPRDRDAQRFYTHYQYRCVLCNIIYMGTIRMDI